MKQALTNFKLSIRREYGASLQFRHQLVATREANQVKHYAYCLHFIFEIRMLI